MHILSCKNGGISKYGNTIAITSELNKQLGDCKYSTYKLLLLVPFIFRSLLLQGNGKEVTRLAFLTNETQPPIISG